jgi:hypothetical protein
MLTNQSQATQDSRITEKAAQLLGSVDEMPASQFLEICHLLAMAN